MVKMTHPNLPGREIEVPEVGVGHRERAGWQRAKPGDDTGGSVPEPMSVKNDTGKPEKVTKSKGKSQDDEGEN